MDMNYDSGNRERMCESNYQSAEGRYSTSNAHKGNYSDECCGGSRYGN